MASDIVLVSGATGFIAKQCIVQLLQAGYAVRGTVRCPEQASAVYEGLSRHVNLAGLELVCADLDHDRGWHEAAQNCAYVLHIASPLPRTMPRDPDAMIASARDGTLRVLRAARDQGVKRVVMTSSVSAVSAGHERGPRTIFDESHWSNLNGHVTPYERSKTLAERAAWEFHALAPDAFEFTTILPGMVLGPLLDKHGSTSSEIVRKLCAGEIPGCPDLRYAFIDVRDLAACHLAALTCPQAAGRRYICAGEEAQVLELAHLLAAHFGPSRSIPTRPLPNWLLRLVARFDKTTALVAHELGKSSRYLTAAAQSDLGLRPRPLNEMAIAMAESFETYGVHENTRSPWQPALDASKWFLSRVSSRVSQG